MADLAVAEGTPAQAPREVRLRHAQLEFIREDLLAPVRALLRFSELLWEDLRESRPRSIVDRFKKMRSAAAALHRLASDGMQAALAESTEDSFRQALRAVHTEIRTKLSAVLGFCQILKRREAENFFGTFTAELARIEHCCFQCREKLIDDSPMTIPELPDGLDGAMEDQEPPGTLLLIEPNPATADLHSSILKQCGHRVHRASGVRDAIDLMERGGIDLVLSELIFPELSGFDLMRQMRQRGLSRHLPLVVVSAWDESERAAYCIKLGADDYIKKPVVECLLHARVKSCLAKARRRRAELERFFPSDVARQLLENPEALDVGQEAEVTVLFSDIRNFSSVSARLGAKKTVEWVRDIMTTLSECVIRHGGTLVNYVGDEVMAVWGAPMATDDHAWQACQAALEMREERGPLTERWEKVIGQPVRFGVGVNTGPVQIGNIGTKRKFQYGPLGDTVNVASRVQGATKFVRQPLLITRATYDAVGPSFPARRVASVRMVNIPDPVSVFEPAPMSKTGGWIDLRWAYEDALLAFEEMRFAKCVQTLGSLLGRFPEDGPARLLLARASACLADPPPPDEFDPTWDFKQK